MPTTTPLFDTYTPWSISKSDLASKCSRAFHFRYVDKMFSVGGTEAKIGTCAHLMQEYILKHEAPRDALARALAESPDLTSKEQLAVEALMPACMDYYARIQRFKERKGIVEEVFEQPWAVDREFKAVGWDDPTAIFRGKIDYGMVTPERYLIVHDHKSGRDKGLTAYQKQLDAYAVLGLANMHEISGVQAALHYMKTKNIVWHAMRNVTAIRTMLQPWLLGMLRQRSERLHEPTPSLSPLCKWCDYKEHCPEGLEHIQLITPKRKPRKKKGKTGEQ